MSVSAAIPSQGRTSRYTRRGRELGCRKRAEFVVRLVLGQHRKVGAAGHVGTAGAAGAARAGVWRGIEHDLIRERARVHADNAWVDGRVQVLAGLERRRWDVRQRWWGRGLGGGSTGRAGGMMVRSGPRCASASLPASSNGSSGNWGRASIRSRPLLAVSPWMLAGSGLWGSRDVPRAIAAQTGPVTVTPVAVG